MNMDLVRASIVQSDPHRWMWYDDYIPFHGERAAAHGFVDKTRTNTLSFQEIDLEGSLYIHLKGDVYCLKGVALTVEKMLKTRQVEGRLQVFADLYKYIGRIENGTPVLEYQHLAPDLEEYAHRIYNLTTGQELFSEVIARHQIATFTEALNELEHLIATHDPDD